MSRLLAWLLLLPAALLPVAAEAADTGWTITSFHADVRVLPDSSLDIVETIKVDFDGLAKHGIFRDIPYRYDYDQKHYRLYRIQVAQVSNGAGSDWPYTATDQGAYRELKIGDPNRTISGAQTYVIHYRVEGALNGFSDHDELYWNVNGSQWPVPALNVDAAVHVPSGSLQRATCYQGALGSTEACRQSVAGDEIDSAATRTLPPGEQLTVVAAMAKGAVAAPQPMLEQKPRTFFEYFELTPATIGASLLVLLAGLALVSLNWLRNGRDRVALDVHYRESGPPRLRPLLNGPPVIARFEPPDGLRPAEVGTLLDESADTKDVTATIVDLAGRGFLRIDELPHGFLQRKDWKLTATGTPERIPQLKPYEAALYWKLFPGNDTQTQLSELRGHFRDDLQEVEGQLYKDASESGWFASDPRVTRIIWLVVGAAVAVAGAATALGAGALVGWGLVGVALVLVGLAQAVGAFFMPRRTPAGSRLLDQALGFRLYMTTAEKYRQQFAERENIFTDFLPYAIVFGCVERWARAFQGLDQAQVQTSWYGSGGWQALALSQSLQEFNESLGATLAAPPPSSGGSGSGFSGGFSGGGGGGGGGGSW